MPPKPESEETSADEAAESPEVQAQELASGEEEQGTFESSVEDIINKATPEQLKYLKSCVDNALSPTPKEYDIDDMPQ